MILPLLIFLGMFLVCALGTRRLWRLSDPWEPSNTWFAFGANSALETTVMCGGLAMTAAGIATSSIITHVGLALAICGGVGAVIVGLFSWPRFLVPPSRRHARALASRILEAFR